MLDADLEQVVEILFTKWGLGSKKISDSIGISHSEVRKVLRKMKLHRDVKAAHQAAKARRWKQLMKEVKV